MFLLTDLRTSLVLEISLMLPQRKAILELTNNLMLLDTTLFAVYKGKRLMDTMMVTQKLHSTSARIN